MALEWATETLRLSLFSSDTMRTTLADWTKLTGQDEPETVQNVAARRSMIGEFQGGVLNVIAVGPRVDCILLSKAPTETIEEGYVPTVGAWPAACMEFQKATFDWLAGIEQPIFRIAFGGTILAKCQTPKDAYKQLLILLRSVRGDPDKMRDLNFRVNWPINSGAVENLTLNRITSWSVLQIQLQLMTQTGAKTVVSDTPVTSVIRFEFDHNTDADRNLPFDRKALAPIYNELVALALENAEKGEVT
jgi:hypothetical protein